MLKVTLEVLRSWGLYKVKLNGMNRGKFLSYDASLVRLLLVANFFMIYLWTTMKGPEVTRKTSIYFWDPFVEQKRFFHFSANDEVHEAAFFTIHIDVEVRETFMERKPQKLGVFMLEMRNEDLKWKQERWGKWRQSNYKTRQFEVFIHKSVDI